MKETKKMDAQYFTSFIDQHFDTMFERSGKGFTRLKLQDGDPSQNSESARDAMACCHWRSFENTATKSRLKSY